MRLCQDIMLMYDFAELAERDLHGDKLTEDEFKWLISLERAAGVLEIG